MVRTPPEVMSMVPPFVKVVLTVNNPEAPNVKLLAERIVSVPGLLATVPFAVTACAMVTLTAAGGTTFPNQVVFVFQSVETFEIHPKNVNPTEADPLVIVFVTTSDAPEAFCATTAVIVVELTTVNVVAATPPIVTDMVAVDVNPVPVIVKV
jgi:hypothetical protein